MSAIIQVVNELALNCHCR